MKSEIPISRRYVRACALAASVVAVLPLSQFAHAQEAVSALWLSADARTVPVGPKLHGGLLTRELVRQAVLMAARDELGATARDEGLGDPPPENAGSRSIAWRIHVLTPRPNRFRIELSSIDKTPEVRVFTKAFDVDPDPARYYASMLPILERESRIALVDALKKAGLTNQRKKLGDRKPDLVRIDELLSNMDFVSQFAAVRLAHGQISELGESSELLQRLVRAYSHLAMLTQHFWSATGDIFAARALVYAERLSASSNRSPVALAHRAYARALCGTHAAALADLAELQKLPAPLNEPAAGVPTWIAIIDAYCHFDREKLQSAGEGDAPMSQLSKLLVARINDALADSLRLGGQISTAIEQLPEVYGQFPPLMQSSSIYIPRVQSARATMDNFGRRLPARIRNTAEIPQNARALVPADPGNTSAEENGQFRMRAIDDRFPETPVKIADALDYAAAAEPSGEPSWRALSGMIRNEAFSRVAMNTSANPNSGSVRLSNTQGDLVQPYIAGHPYETHIRGYALDRNRQTDEFNRFFNDLRIIDPNPWMWRMYDRIWLVTAGARYIGSRAMNDALEQRDFSCEYLMACIRNAEIMIPDNKPVAAMYEGMLSQIQAVSPFCPVAVRAAMEQITAPSPEQLANWEKVSVGDPRASRSLGIRYREMGRHEDAIRVLEQSVKLSPTSAAFVDLAEAYRLSGQPELWKPTLERFLPVSGPDWVGGRIRDRIAQDHISRSEWKLAEPYAVEAASAGEELTAITASEVYEGLEDWTKSEEYIRGVSIKSRDKEKLNWYFWCRRTGRGDLEAARTLARQYMSAPLATDLLAPEAFGVFEILEGDREKAMAQFNTAWNRRRESEWTGLHIVLLVAEEKNQPATDQILIKLMNQTKPDDPKTPAQIRNSVRLVVDQMAGGSSTAFDGDALLTALNEMDRESRAKFGYFFGRIAQLAGDKKTAEKCYRRSLDGGLFREYNATLSAMRFANLQEKSP